MSAHPPPEDHALSRAAYEHADRIDQAQTAEEKRKTWGGFIPRAIAVLAEGFLRDWLIIGAILLSLIVGGVGAASGQAAWITLGIALGALGIVAIVIALVRRWPLGRQWAAILSVLLADCVFFVVYGWLG